MTLLTRFRGGTTAKVLIVLLATAVVTVLGGFFALTFGVYGAVGVRSAFEEHSVVQWRPGLLDPAACRDVS
jgi:hypothetical protein